MVNIILIQKTVSLSHSTDSSVNQQKLTILILDVEEQLPITYYFTPPYETS